MLIHPLRRLDPTTASLGTDSPVKEDVLIIDVPSRTIASKGIFSPGLIIISSPN